MVLVEDPRDGVAEDSTYVVDRLVDEEDAPPAVPEPTGVGREVSGAKELRSFWKLAEYEDVGLMLSELDW